MCVDYLSTSPITPLTPNSKERAGMTFIIKLRKNNRIFSFLLTLHSNPNHILTTYSIHSIAGEVGKVVQRMRWKKNPQN